MKGKSNRDLAAALKELSVFKYVTVALKAFFTGFLISVFYRVHLGINQQVAIAETQRAMDSVNGPGTLSPLVLHLYFPLMLVIAFLAIFFVLWHKELKQLRLILKEVL